MLIYGKNPVIEALRASRKIETIYLLDHLDETFFEGYDIRGIRMEKKTRGQMDALFPGVHQGVGARVAPYDDVSLQHVLKKTKKKLFVMLDEITDPHNVGAIIRTAAAFKADAVILQKRRGSAITPTVVKVSSGGIEHVDIVRVTNLNQTIETLKKHDIWVVGAALDGDTTLENVPHEANLCLVLGSEGKGLRRLVRKHCDMTVNIPMLGEVESLNVSVACGILLYDITRRR